MAMMSAYFDESTSENSPVLVVAGFLSTDAHWSLFEREWKEVLEEFEITAFHMHDYAQSAGEFVGMDEPTRRALLGRLLEIIIRRAKLGFASVVHCKEFERIFTGPERIDVGSPYNLSCTASYLQIGEWARNNFQVEPVAYFFDAGHKDAPGVARTFLETKNNPGNVEHRLGSLTFEHDNVLVPLQAADLAAYELWRWLDEHFLNKTLHGRFPMEQLNRIKWKIREFDKGVLEEMLAHRRGEKVDPKVIHNFIPALRSGRTAPPRGEQS
jgi:hypothetical protein